MLPRIDEQHLQEFLHFVLVLQSKGVVPKDGKLTNAFIRVTCQAETCTAGQDLVSKGTKLEASKQQNLSFSKTQPTPQRILSGPNSRHELNVHELTNICIFNRE